MKKTFLLFSLSMFLIVARTALADDFEIQILGGAIELGGEITISVKDADKSVPKTATCRLEIPEPYESHLNVVSSDCSELRLKQGFEPLLDDAGYAIPSAQVPYGIVVTAENGSVGLCLESGGNSPAPFSERFDLRLIRRRGQGASA